MPQTNRLLWLDALRLVAGVSMVVLHATADSSGQPWTDHPPADRIAPMLLRAVIYSARTELFIIISAFLLIMALDRRPRSYATTITEQAKRLLIPFLFWTGFYAIFNFMKATAFGYHESYLTNLLNPVSWLGYIFLGDIKYHMHFIPTLFGIIVFFPIFKLATRYPQIGFCVLFCLLAKRELDDFIWSTLYGTEVVGFAIRFIKVISYIGYGVVAASAYGIWIKYSRRALEQWVPLTLFVTGLLFLIKLVSAHKTIISGTWPHSYTAGYYADFLMPICLFWICLSLGHRNWPNSVGRLAPYSFGIYLCHPIFLDMFEIAQQNREFIPIVHVILKVTGTLILTSAFVILLSRFSILSWTVGLGIPAKSMSYSELHSIKLSGDAK